MTRSAVAEPQRSSDETSRNRRMSSAQFDSRTTAHCPPVPPSRQRILAEPHGRLSSAEGSQCLTSANSWQGSSTTT